MSSGVLNGSACFICLLCFLRTLPFSVGCVFCDPKEPIRACTRFRARILLFNIDVPITQGFPVSESKNNLMHFLISHTGTVSVVLLYVRLLIFAVLSLCAWRRYCCITRQSVSRPPLGNLLAFYIRAVAKFSRRNQSEFQKRGIVSCPVTT